MRKLLALMLAVCLWFSFAPIASADSYANLTPCSENPAFLARAELATTEQAVARFDRYSQALCGEEGLPHLIVDGNLAHAGDFLIPGILFLYIAGYIGWTGRSYLQAIKKGKNPEDKEILIDIPLAISCSLASAAWPAAAFGQISSGAMFAKDDEIPISPR